MLGTQRSRTFQRRHDFHKGTFSLSGYLSFKEKTCVAHTSRWTLGWSPEVLPRAFKILPVHTATLTQIGEQFEIKNLSIPEN